MKHALVTAFVTAALGLNAFAGSISLDSRADYEATTYNDAAKAAIGKRDNQRFALTSLRLDSKGNLNEQTSFRLRFRLNKGSLNVSEAQDNLNNSIDYAYIQHNWMENLGFQIGKFGTDIGGIEGMTNSADLYLKSQAYGGGTLTTT
ncbi:MAG: porin, partial [Pseudobdellovibrionaceae bacterium]